MRQKVKNRMAEVGKFVNMTSELGVSFHSDKKRECKRMGKRIYGIRSFAYRIPHPHAATASRLRLPRIWNPSLSSSSRIRAKTVRHVSKEPCRAACQLCPYMYNYTHITKLRPLIDVRAFVYKIFLSLFISFFL